MPAVRRIANPSDVKAEGTVGKFAYDTVLVSIDGVALHLWTMEDAEPSTHTLDEIREAYRIMRKHRDIVYCTYSTGKPAGFWANDDIECKRPR
ncbi:MAG: hypothetical protein PBV01_11565 [Brucella anthropi]